jgi:hypothetical protein
MPPCKCQDSTSIYAMTALFHICLNSSFTNYCTMWKCLVWDLTLNEINYKLCVNLQDVHGS